MIAQPKALKLAQIFKQASGQLSLVMSKLNLFLNPSPQNFESTISSFNEPAIEAAIERIRFYQDLCERFDIEKVDYDERQYVWYAIKKLGVKFSSDLFNYIDPHDCIEIYDKNGIQVYRSFNFSKYTSYSLEEILFYPWYELFYREHEILEQMSAVAKQVFSGQISGVSPINIRKHICEEIKGLKYKTEVQFKYICPLATEKGDIEYFLASCELTKV